jgi:hypothetical protein
LTTCLLDNSPVGVLVRLISDAAAPLAGLSAATLAYSAAAMLPVWLPIALGGRGKRSTLFEERQEISDKLEQTSLYDRDFQPIDKVDKVRLKLNDYINRGHLKERLRKFSRKLASSNNISF